MNLLGGHLLLFYQQSTALNQLCFHEILPKLSESLVPPPHLPQNTPKPTEQKQCSTIPHVCIVQSNIHYIHTPDFWCVEPFFDTVCKYLEYLLRL